MILLLLLNAICTTSGLKLRNYERNSTNHDIMQGQLHITASFTMQHMQARLEDMAETEPFMANNPCQVPALEILAKFANDAERALRSGNVDDQQNVFDVENFMDAWLVALRELFTNDPVPSFQQFWHSMPQADAGYVAADTFVNKATNMSGITVTHPQYVMFTGYVDPNHDGRVYPKEALDWIHAVTWYTGNAGAYFGGFQRTSARDPVDWWCFNYGYTDKCDWNCCAGVLP